MQSPFNTLEINNIIILCVIVRQKTEMQLIKKEIINKFFLLKILKINMNKIVPKILPKCIQLPNKPNFLSSILRYSLIIVEADVNKPVSIDIKISINKYMIIIIQRTFRFNATSTLVGISAEIELINDFVDSL